MMRMSKRTFRVGSVMTTKRPLAAVTSVSGTSEKDIGSCHSSPTSTLR